MWRYPSRYPLAWFLDSELQSSKIKNFSKEKRTEHLRPGCSWAGMTFNIRGSSRGLAPRRSLPNFIIPNWVGRDGTFQWSLPAVSRNPGCWACSRFLQSHLFLPVLVRWEMRWSWYLECPPFLVPFPNLTKGLQGYNSNFISGSRRILYFPVYRNNWILT